MLFCVGCYMGLVCSGFANILLGRNLNMQISFMLSCMYICRSIFLSLYI